MKITKMLGLACLAFSVVGDAASKTTKVGAGIVEYGAYGAKKVAQFTEATGYYAKEGSKWTEKQSNDLYNYSQKLIYQQDGYTCQSFDFNDEVIDGDWTFIDYAEKV